MEMAATALVAAALAEGDRGGDEEGGEGTEGSGSDSSSTDEEGTLLFKTNTLSCVVIDVRYNLDMINTRYT